MMNGWSSTKSLTLLTSVGLIAFAGCAVFHPSSLLPMGQIVRTHGKPLINGNHNNWDPQAVKVTLDRVDNTSPIGNMEVYVASVMDKNNKFLAGRRIEWVIAEGGVGDIIEVDEVGLSNSRGYKVNNQYAVTHTNYFDHVLDRGTDDPSDDILIKAGQTWCVVTSPVEGQSHLMAYAPAIYNWKEHMAKATQNWFDVAWDKPEASVDAAGSFRELTTRVYKYSDGSPLVDYQVRYEIVGGPDAHFDIGSGKIAFVRTDRQGVATIRLFEDRPMEGTNDIRVTVVRPEDTRCCEPAVNVANGMTQATWVVANAKIAKVAPETTGLGQTFTIPITISNPSDLVVKNAVVTDTLPPEFEYISSDPPARFRNGKVTWDLGSLHPGVETHLTLKVRATQRGLFGSSAELHADMGVQDSDYAETRVVESNLTIEFETTASATPCDPVDFKITVRNKGETVIKNVKVFDEIPDGLMVYGGDTTHVYNVGTLKPGEAKLVSFQADPQRGGIFISKAIATGDGGQRVELNSTTVIEQPRLMITKFGPEKHIVGKVATFDITVTNTGNNLVQNASVMDEIPVGMSFVSATHGGTLTNGKVFWRFNSLAPGESVTVSHTLQPNTAGLARSTAWAMTKCAEASATTETEITGLGALKLEMYDTNDPIQVGDTTTYEVRVTNQGSAPINNIRIHCKLPYGQQFVSSDGPTNGVSAGDQVTFDPLPILAPKQTVLFQIKIKSLRPGDVRFKAAMTSDQFAEPVFETESTNMY